MRVKMASVCLGVLGFWAGTASLVQAKTADNWESRRPIKTPRQEVGVAWLDGHVYVIGGILQDRSTTGIVERYDPGADEWKSVTALPDDTRVHHVGAASCGGKLYAIGGLNSGFRGTSGLFAFDPTTGEWERKADLLTVRPEKSIRASGGEIWDEGTAESDACGRR